MMALWNCTRSRSSWRSPPKSFSRAAERLLRTQPAVSLALQRLEAELSEKLIDRSAKDMVLTDAGRTVLEFAQSLPKRCGSRWKIRWPNFATTRRAP